MKNNYMKIAVFVFPRACPPANSGYADVILHLSVQTGWEGLKQDSVLVPGLKFSLQVSETPELSWELARGGVGI